MTCFICLANKGKSVSSYEVCRFCLLTTCRKHAPRKKHNCQGDYDVQAEIMGII